MNRYRIRDAFNGVTILESDSLETIVNEFVNRPLMSEWYIQGNSLPKSHKDAEYSWREIRAFELRKLGFTASVSR